MPRTVQRGRRPCPHPGVVPVSGPARYAVPAWLEPLLPDVVAPLLLDVVDGDGGEVFWGIAADGTRRRLGTSLEDAYDAAGDVDVLFSDAVRERYGEEGPDGCLDLLWVPSHAGFHRLLLTRTDAHRVARLADAWARFRELDTRWRADPSSFLDAFAWIDAHPAFWIRSGVNEPGHPDWRDADFWRWETADHMQRVDIRPIRLDDGTTAIALETGGHVSEMERWERGTGTAYVVEDVYRTHYYDPRLDVSAPTFEEAVRRLALAIDAVFDLDGEERPEAPAPAGALSAEVATMLGPRSDPWADRRRVRFSDLGTGPGTSVSRG